MLQAARQQLERLPRRQAQTNTSNAASSTSAPPTASAAAVVSANSATSNGELGSGTPSAPVNLQFLLSRCVLFETIIFLHIVEFLASLKLKSTFQISGVQSHL